MITDGYNKAHVASGMDSLPLMAMYSGTPALPEECRGGCARRCSWKRACLPTWYPPWAIPTDSYNSGASPCRQVRRSTRA